MGYTVSELLRIAVAEIGYKEKETNAQLDDKTANAGDNNWTKYARDLQKAGYYQAGKNGYAWCDMFVDWCFLQLCGGDKAKAEDMICQTGLYGAGCEWSAKYYRQQGRFFTSGPMPGDQIFFNDYAHTGIVEKIEGGKVHTIEGNTSNMVARRTYTLGSSSIDGYGRPKYDAEAEQAPMVLGGAVSGYGKASLQRMYDHLKKLGYSTAGIYGMLANANGESACKSNNLQNTGNNKLGMTDEEYTAAVDNGSYTNFAKDGHGYGLFQWTYHTRKAALLAFARAAGQTIGADLMQLDFADKELREGYKSLYKLLQATTDITEASNAFMTQFERPADQSEAAQAKRAAYGFQIKELLEGKQEETPEPTKPDEPEKPTVPVAELPEVGQIVSFEGTIHYISSNAKKGVKCKPGKAKVTSRNKGAAHPVHLVKVSGGGSTVYGWVDLADITVIHTPAATIGEGSKVKIKEGAAYGGLSSTRGKAVPGWVCKRTLTVIDIAEHHGVKEARLQEINSWVAVASLTLA